MDTTVSRPRRWGWLALDLAGSAALVLGMLVLVAPDTAAAIGLPARWGWPLIIVGGIAMSWAMLLFIRQSRAARTP